MIILIKGKEGGETGRGRRGKKEGGRREREGRFGRGGRMKIREGRRKRGRRDWQEGKEEEKKKG